METIFAYEREPYLRRLTVEVLESGEEDDRPFAILSDTILYPEGGGQPPDHGHLGEVAVTDVQAAGGQVRHYLESSIAPGPATLTLDWGRRFDHMQQHTAQHLLSAVAADRFGWQTTSFHLGTERSDVELGTAQPSPSDLALLEERVAAEIRAARRVWAQRVDAETAAAAATRSRGLPAGHRGSVRLVEIDGIDVTTCGGTHLTSTAEIECLKLLGSEPMRGGTRLHWVAGGRVRARLAEHEARNEALRRLLETSDAELTDIAGLRLDQLKQSRARERDLEGRLAESVADLLVLRREAVVNEHFDGLGAPFLQQLARRLTAAGTRRALLTAELEEQAFFVVLAAEGDGPGARDLGPSVAQILDGRGGGKPPLFQGRAGTLRRRDEAFRLIRESLVGDGEAPA